MSLNTRAIYSAAGNSVIDAIQPGNCIADMMAHLSPVILRIPGEYGAIKKAGTFEYFDAGDGNHREMINNRTLMCRARRLRDDITGRRFRY